MTPLDAFCFLLMAIIEGEKLAQLITMDMPVELKEKIWKEHSKNFDRFLDIAEKVEQFFNPDEKPAP